MVQKTNVQPRHIHWLGIIGSIMLASAPAVTLAQIAGDGTLGTQVNGNLTAPCTGTCIITNGAPRGNNLFHSFRQFSLPNGDFAGFVTTPAIQNVIVRVTGVGQPFISNINGTIATSNPANFFLLNPNGIIFGPGAALNIGGSFLATTANRMQFADGTEFRTNDPTPLLTVSVPTGLQFNAAPGNIQMQGTQLFVGDKDNFSDFALVGGDVTLDNSIISTSVTPGRRVELAGVGENGTVGLQLNADRLSLSFAAGTPRRDITLSNGSKIDASVSTSGGDVLVTGRNITLDRSDIITGIFSDIDNAATNQAGDITIDAVANLQLTQDSSITNVVFQNAIGQGGNISITTDSLLVTNSLLGANTFGQGDAGNVTIDVRNAATLNSSFVTSQVLGLTGKGGDVRFIAGSLAVTNDAQISTVTNTRGDAGNITINVRDHLLVDGVGSNGFTSAVISTVETEGVGRGGAIIIQTGSLEIRNGAAISTNFLGQGNGGSITIDARNTVSLNAVGFPGNSTGIFSNSFPGAIGEVGDIAITAESLSLTGGAQISAATFGQGNAGGVNIVTRDKVFLGGVGSNGRSSAIFSSVQLEGIGNGRDITITTPSLVIAEGATISGSTRGQGNGGNIIVNAKTLEALSGGQLITNTLKGGNAGNIILNVTDSVILSGSDPTYADRLARFGGRVGNVGATSGLFASTTIGSTGNGGNIFIDPRTVILRDGGQIAVDSQGTGKGGDIQIQAGRLTLDNQALISAETASNQGGNITLNVQDLLLLRHDSEISTSAGLAGAGGNGGNITINAAKGFLITAPNENNDITANAFNGSGGRVTINTQGIYNFTPRSRADLAQLLGTNDPTQLDPRRLPTNDITAISQGNPDLSGTVTLNVLNLDPSRGLVALPLNLTDPSQQISQSCTPGDKTAASSFVSTGRGGIPLNPDEPLESRAVGTQWVALPGEVRGAEKQGEQRTQESGRNFNRQPSTSNSPAPIVEAQGWIVRADGTMVLVADSPTTNPASVWNPSLVCQMPQGR